MFNELHVSSGGSIIFVIKAPVLFIRHEKANVKLSGRKEIMLLKRRKKTHDK